MMIKNNKKKFIKWIIVISVLAVVSILLILALSSAQIFESTVIRSETTSVIVVFAILLPILLLLLLTVHLVDRKRGNDGEIFVREIASVKIAQAATDAEPASAEAEERPVIGGEVSRFCMLSRIDENKDEYRIKSFDDNVSLKKFCEDFRNFAASELRLYYDIKDIRRFIAGLLVSPIVILQGMSGTGKTSLAHAMGKFVVNTSTVIPVQPMWKERTDLLGYYNEFTRRFNETKLLEKMYEANYSEEIYITVMDEMNIARVEYYFAEFLSLLELPNPEERYIDVVSDVWDNDPKLLKDGRIKLPINMWFIGTANNDDSTFAISDKVYDRAMILNLDSKCDRFIAPKTKPTKLSARKFRELGREALDEYALTKRNLKRLEELDKYLIENFHITFGNRIMKQIREYVPIYMSCGGEELEALDDILAKKIIRKLETQNPIYLRRAAEGLCTYMEELFGVDRMPLCIDAIHRLQRNA